MASSGVEENLKRLLGPLLLVLIFFLIASYFVAMVLGPLVFFSTADGLAVSKTPIQRLPFVFLGVYVDVGVSMSVGMLFLSIWFVFLVCFFVASVVREDVFVSFEKLRSGAMVASFRNYLLFMPVVAGFSFMSTLFIDLFLEMLGIPVEGPKIPGDGTGEFWELRRFLSISYAPIVEEIGFRLIPVGVFIVVYLFLVRRRNAASQAGGCSRRSLVLALNFPDKAKKDCGLRSVDGFGFLRGISGGEWVVILLTSVVFGLAHFPFGSWGPGKFLSAAVVGVFLGVVYLAYGFFAPILLHWFFNYYFNVFSLASSYFWRLSGVLFLVFFANLLFGLFVFVAVVYTFVRRVWRKPESKPPDVL